MLFINLVYKTLSVFKVISARDMYKRKKYLSTQNCADKILHKMFIDIMLHLNSCMQMIIVSRKKIFTYNSINFKTYSTLIISMGSGL